MTGHIGGPDIILGSRFGAARGQRIEMRVGVNARKWTPYEIRLPKSLHIGKSRASLSCLKAPSRRLPVAFEPV